MNKNIPFFLYNKLLNQYGLEITNTIIDGYKENRITSLRVNNIKSNINKIITELDSNNINYRTLEWYKDALILDISENEIRKLNIYKNGDIYLQSLSSMIPVLILDPKENETILDMAAAPGGKTSQIASITNNKAAITAVEINKIRAERLKYNLEKQGIKRVGIVNKNAFQLDDNFSFDKILLDAPCSGSGTLKIGDTNSYNMFNNEIMNKITSNQIAMLNKSIRLLKVGQEIVYSTCSILSIENEEVVNKVLKSNNNIELVKIDHNLFKYIPLLPVQLEGTICIKPTKEYEGFFIAKLKKIK